MSVDPKEAQAFANILGKLDGVQQGTETVDVNAGRQKRMADNDMTSILSAFASTSGTPSALTLTPEALTENLSKAQKSADQVGAEFEPKTISPVLGEPEKDHPMAGMLVGEADEEIKIPTEDGITMQDIRLLAGEGKLSEKTIQQAIEVIRKQRKNEDEEINEQDVEEMIRKLPGKDKYRLYSKDGKKNLGTFDSRAAAEKHEREVQYFKHKNESIEEDSLSDIKKRLGDYLQDIKNGAKADDGELSKKNDEEKLGPAIKTITTDDGKEIKIHGNEDDGFRLKVNEKIHSARFKSFDEAQMACETYVAKRKTATENQDYVEEK